MPIPTPVPSPRLWLVRHGQTDWNAVGRIQGQSPTELNAAGRSEAAGALRIATAALAAQDYQTSRASGEKAWALESKAYSELLAMTNDMIHGVLFYLALLVPFAYCLERIFRNIHALEFDDLVGKPRVPFEKGFRFLQHRINRPLDLL